MSTKEVESERSPRRGIPVGVVVVGHGRFAVEMVATLLSLVGDLDGVEGIAHEPDADCATLRRAIEDAVDRVEKGNGAIIFGDMFGDTATNLSLKIAAERPNVEVVAGVNMPMLLKLTTARFGTTAQQLAGFLRRYGQEHICWPTGVTPGA